MDLLSFQAFFWSGSVGEELLVFSVSTVSSSAILSESILIQLESDLQLLIGDEIDLENVIGVLEQVEVSLGSLGGVLVDECSCEVNWMVEAPSRITP